MRRELSVQELEVLLLPAGASQVQAEAVHNLLFVQRCDKDELQKFLVYEDIVKDATDTAVCESIFAAMKPSHQPVVVHGTVGGTTRQSTSTPAPATPLAPVAKSSAATMIMFLGLVSMFVTLGIVGWSLYLFQSVSAQVDTLQQQVADLRGFFYQTQTQGQDNKGNLLWKCQLDRDGNIILREDGKCPPSSEPFMVDVPPKINGIIGKAIEERALSAVDLVVQTRLGDFLAVLERGKTDPASVPDGGLATLDECLAVADGGSLPQAAACCARTPILTQTSCRMAIRCKLDPMAPPEICPKK